MAETSSRPRSVVDAKSEKTHITSNEVPVSSHLDDIPDGGTRAWLVVLGAAFSSFATFGFLNAWGVFQAYYTETLLRDRSPSDIAWIGSVQYCLIFLPGLVSGRLFDMGYFRITLFAASCTLVTATFLVAECTEFWHFLFCQGFAIGISCGMIFGPSLTVVSHWFNKKRGAALGLVSIGSSLGGTIFPIAARNLITAVGFKWTMRILGFIVMFGLIICNLLVTTRLPPRKVTGPFMDFEMFRYKPFAVYCVATFVTFLGLYTVLTYIDISAVSAGLSSDFSFYLVSITNASSGFGRISGGLLADRFGAMNVMIPFTICAAVLSYAWPFATTKGAFVAIAVLYGATSGVYVSLLPSPPMAMGDLQSAGMRMGMSTVGLGLGLLGGPPIAGAIIDRTHNYKGAGYYAGSIVILAVILLVITRQLRLEGKLRGKC
ncbi:hypothetical protein QCA50_010783 [Cerrena zonata]|uniref:Major facilitator superfamily (MFS) profile domain-containing protein n=1 Tax=Cerrena zonata TaxID=2478898 RepID=A0AAW0FWV8_9APHY